MRFIGYGFIILIIYFLQVNFFGVFRPFGVVPNLFLILILFMGLARPASEAIGAAIAGGALLDIASGADFGLRMAAYTVFALVIIVLAQTGTNVENLGLITALIFAATMVYNVAIAAGIAPVLGMAGIMEVLTLSLMEAAVNIAGLFVMGPLFGRIIKRPAQQVPVIGGSRRDLSL